MTRAQSVDDAVRAGYAVYTPFSLRFYDLVVLGISNRFIWKCPTELLVEHYDRHVSSNHLDVGVGTGYFLDRCRFPTASPRLVLMDLSTHSLDATSRRVSRYRPEVVRRNVLEPIAFDGEPFDSIGLNYLIHCVPGSLPEKAVLFDNLGALLNPGGTIFGATLLTDGVERGRLARRLMGVYNKKGIFGNARDSLTDLRRALDERFRDVSVHTVGCAAIFSARKA